MTKHPHAAFSTASRCASFRLEMRRGRLLLASAQELSRHDRAGISEGPPSPAQNAAPTDVATGATGPVEEPPGQERRRGGSADLADDVPTFVRHPARLGFQMDDEQPLEPCAAEYRELLHQPVLSLQALAEALDPLVGTATSRIRLRERPLDLGG